jgi:SAM-dependent methyltransferase
MSESSRPAAPSAAPAFKDLFSTQSGDYARYRPSYPADLFTWLAASAPGRACAVDVATGSGQAALGLAPHFDRVIAVDASAAQLAHAPARANVTYRVAPAEATGVDDHSVDLLAAAQAFHWFRQDQFFAEVDRVLRPGGLLAVWCYGFARITPAVDALVHHLYGDILGPYWEPERRLVEEGYASVAFPFTPLDPPPFETALDWSLPDLLGYLRTWSALRAYARAHNVDPLLALEPEFARAWGNAGPRTARWSLSVRAVRR